MSMIKAMLVDPKGAGIPLGEFDPTQLQALVALARQENAIAEGVEDLLVFHYAAFNLKTGVFEIHFDGE